MWQIKPGLGAYASDPDSAARSMEPLLEKAEAVIPEELHPYTPVKVGVITLLLLPGKRAKLIKNTRDTLNIGGRWKNFKHLGYPKLSAKWYSNFIKGRNKNHLLHQLS